MKQHWLSRTIGAAALVIATAWIRMDVANAIPFTPPSDNSAPRSATGGASRGSFFTPPTNNATPQQATGGAARNNFFTPPTESRAPQDTASGASRGDFFSLPTDVIPQGSVEGAARDLPTGQQEGEPTSSSNARSNLYDRVPTTSSTTAESMLAVVPDSFYGTTLEARPTIFVYVPASDIDTAVFSLKNEAKRTIYQMTIAVPKNGGVVAVQMPDEAPALIVLENYQWYVALHVEGELSPGSPFVDGWIKRVEPSSELRLALAQSEGLSNVETLGKNGVWYDTISQLAHLRGGAQDNQAIADHWYELLESVGLADIAAEPIVM